MALSPGMPMRKRHSYGLGLNTYDHDVSACLLLDGAIAFAVARRVKQQEI